MKQLSEWTASLLYALIILTAAAVVATAFGAGIVLAVRGSGG